VVFDCLLLSNSAENYQSYSECETKVVTFSVHCAVGPYWCKRFSALYHNGLAITSLQPASTAR